MTTNVAVETKAPRRDTHTQGYLQKAKPNELIPRHRRASVMESCNPYLSHVFPLRECVQIVSGEHNKEVI